MARTTTNYSLTLETKLGKKVEKKARRLHGKRGFSKHVATVLQTDLAQRPPGA